MRNTTVAMVVALLATAGCSDRLSQMQDACKGTWALASRELADGRTLSSPAIEGVMHWEPIDARKAHVSMTLVRNAGEKQTVDHAVSTFEISTSAITRKRHALVQRGYRDREGATLSHYVRAKTEKGKASIEDGQITYHHAAKDAFGGTLVGDDGFTEVFGDGVMTATYTDAFKDTWRRIK
jgi:hypothetical protein